MKTGQVTTAAELAEFLQWVGSFHDGIIKEMHWVNFDSVDAEYFMSVSRGSTARLLVQRQWENPSAVEIIFHDLLWVILDAREMVFSSGGEPIDDYLKLMIEESEFVFKSFSYRDVSDWMGEELRFGEPFAEAPQVQGGWGAATSLPDESSPSA